MTSVLKAFRDANTAVENTLESCCITDCVDEADRFIRFLIAQVCMCDAAVPLLEAVTCHKLPKRTADCPTFTKLSSSHAKDPQFTPDVWYNLLVKRMRCPCKYVDKNTVHFLNTDTTGGFDLAQFHHWLKTEALEVPDDMTLALFFFVNLSQKNLVQILSSPKFAKHTKIPADRLHDLVNKFSRTVYADSDSYNGTWMMILKNTTFDDKPVLKKEPAPLEKKSKPPPAEPAQPLPAAVPKPAEVPAPVPSAPEMVPTPTRPAFEEAMQEEEVQPQQGFTPETITSGQVVATQIACPIDGECAAVRKFRAAVKLRTFVDTRGAAKRLVVALFGGRNWRGIYVKLFPADSDPVVDKVNKYRRNMDDMTPEEWQNMLKTATTDVAPTAMPEETQRALSEFRGDVTESNLPAKQRGETISDVVSQIVTLYAPNWQDKWCQRWKLSNGLVHAVDNWKAAHPGIPTPVRVLLLVLCRSA